MFHPQKMDNFHGKSKLNFWTKNEDFEQCDASYPYNQKTFTFFSNLSNILCFFLFFNFLIMTTLVSHSLCFHAIFRTLQWHQSFCSFSEDDDSKIKNKILFALVSLCPVVFHLLYKFRKILITIFQRTQRQIQVIIGSWIGIGSTSIVGC